MDSRIGYQSRSYTDIQDLQKLHGESKTNPAAVKKEVTQQFEAMLVQMVLHSMRDANKTFSSGMYGSDQMDFYEDMFDKQLALSISTNGVDIGFAKMVSDNIDHASGVTSSDAESASGTPVPFKGPSVEAMSFTPVIKSDVQAAAITANRMDQTGENKEEFQSEEDFLKKLWPSAKLAANMIGASPAILLAQAALETQWGKKVISKGNESSHNLFNIKADDAWKDKSMAVNTLEQKNGVLVQEKSSFRTYDSYVDSFKDYVSYLKQNDRYKGALEKAANPAQYIHALHSAGYATDSNYADKILKIFHSPAFQNMAEKLK